MSPATAVISIAARKSVILFLGLCHHPTALYSDEKRALFFSLPAIERHGCLPIIAQSAQHWAN